MKFHGSRCSATQTKIADNRNDMSTYLCTCVSLLFPTYADIMRNLINTFFSKLYQTFRNVRKNYGVCCHAVRWLDRITESVLI
jgi:hypothetical protein